MQPFKNYFYNFFTETLTRSFSYLREIISWKDQILFVQKLFQRAGKNLPRILTADKEGLIIFYQNKSRKYTNFKSKQFKEHQYRWKLKHEAQSTW